MYNIHCTVSEFKIKLYCIRYKYHIDNICQSAGQSLYAIKLLKAHGLDQQSIYDVCKAISSINLFNSRLVGVYQRVRTATTSTPTKPSREVGLLRSNISIY